MWVFVWLFAWRYGAGFPEPTPDCSVPLLKTDQKLSLFFTVRSPHDGAMFDLHCETCDRTYLMGPRRLRRLEDTDAGPVGEAVCPHGHLNRIEFGRDTRAVVGADARSDAGAVA